MVKELFKFLFHLACGNRGLSAWQQRSGVYLAQDIKLRLQNLIAKPIHASSVGRARRKYSCNFGPEPQLALSNGWGNVSEHSTGTIFVFLLIAGWKSGIDAR